MHEIYTGDRSQRESKAALDQQQLKSTTVLALEGRGTKLCCQDPGPGAHGSIADLSRGQRDTEGTRGRRRPHHSWRHHVRQRGRWQKHLAVSPVLTLQSHFNIPSGFEHLSISSYGNPEYVTYRVLSHRGRKIDLRESRSGPAQGLVIIATIYYYVLKTVLNFLHPPCHSNLPNRLVR